MAITGSGAQTLFQSLTKGNGFYIQKKDGTILTCGFSSYTAGNNGLGFVTYGVYIFPVSAEVLVTHLNLDSIGSSKSNIVDISTDKNTLSTS
jgi:hypothetical protein